MIQAAIYVKYICMCYVLVLPYWFQHANQEYEKAERKERGGYTLVSEHFPIEEMSISNGTSFFWLCSTGVAHHFYMLLLTRVNQSTLTVEFGYKNML